MMEEAEQIHPGAKALKELLQSGAGDDVFDWLSDEREARIAALGKDENRLDSSRLRAVVADVVSWDALIAFLGSL